MTLPEDGFPGQAELESYKLYRDRIANENLLVYHRLSWLLVARPDRVLLRPSGSRPIWPAAAATSGRPGSWPPPSDPRPWVFLLSAAGFGWGSLSGPGAAGRVIGPAIAFGLLWAGLCLSLYSLRLTTRVDHRHLHVRSFPLLSKAIPLGDIARW